MITRKPANYSPAQFRTWSASAFLTGRAVLRIFQAVTLLAVTFVALALMNPRLTLLSLATMPVLAYTGYRFGRVYRPLSLEIQQQIAVLTTVLEQNLRGTRVVKAFAQEDAEIEKFEAENNRWFALSERAIRAEALNVPLIDLIAGVSTVLIVWYGGRLVIKRHADPGGAGGLHRLPEPTGAARAAARRDHPGGGDGRLSR